MRIAYFVIWSEPAQGTTYRGAFRKIAAQISAWREFGCEAKLFVLTNKESTLAQWVETLGDFPIHVLTHASRFNQVSQASVIVKDILGWQPDLAYVRYALYLPALQRLAKRVPMVMEVNSDNLTELPLISGYGTRYWYHRISYNWWMKYLRGMVFVTDELSKRPHLARYKIPSLVSGNGIDLADYAPLPAPNNEQPRLVFIGAKKYAWHGVDQILRMAARWPNWQFDIVGPVFDNDAESLPKNVHAHGHLPHARYEAIFAQADVAIGSLGLYTKKMSEASPLKVREYLAHGIPTIIGYHDTDFPAPVPFLLRLPNTPDSVDSNTETIEQFVYSWKGKRIARAEVEHLDVKTKERQRIDFFHRVISSTKPSAR